MEKHEIQIEDFHRILFGQMPAEFFIEVILRTFVIYVLLTVAMRLMGKRMASALSRTEQVAMVSLAAAAGMPLQSAERGLLPAVIIAGVVVAFEKIISFWSFKNQTFEQATQDKLDVLVADGVLQSGTLKRVRINRERLLAELRSNSIKHLGEVKRLYIEANGSFTLVKEKEALPGLCLIPDWDEEYRKKQSWASVQVCKQCGALRPEDTTNCTQ